MGKNANRYSAKLLYQFFFESQAESSFAVVEEKIITFFASDANNAYEYASLRGKKEEYSFINNDGAKVRFRFVGVIDLIHLGIESEEDEVWYSIKKMRSPLHRREKIVPAKASLSAFVNEEKVSDVIQGAAKRQR